MVILGATASDWVSPVIIIFIIIVIDVIMIIIIISSVISVHFNLTLQINY